MREGRPPCRPFLSRTGRIPQPKVVREADALAGGSPALPCVSCAIDHAIPDYSFHPDTASHPHYRQGHDAQDCSAHIPTLPHNCLHCGVACPGSSAVTAGCCVPPPRRLLRAQLRRPLDDWLIHRWLQLARRKDSSRTVACARRCIGQCR